VGIRLRGIVAAHTESNSIGFVSVCHNISS